MTYDYPDGVELLLVHLADLANTRTSRPAGAPLPWITVRRIGGGDDDLTDHGLYSIHCFAGTQSAARVLAGQVDRRMRVLRSVEVNDVVQYVDRVVVIEAPRRVDYVEGVERCVGTYRVDLRLIEIIHDDA